MDQSENLGAPDALHAVVEVNLTIVSVEALLKTCPASASDLASAKDAFTTSAMDFALREKIEAKTSGIRDLLLAKAFSESGVLEDQPEGVFGDTVEEMKLDGMFKILSNPQR
jgi:His-Xaa-Ser system protein HxsD